MLRRSPLRRVSKKRAVQLREYSTRRERYLVANPICEVWLRENGWQKTGTAFEFEKASPVGPPIVLSALQLVRAFNAPRSIEIHHVNKRRGDMLNDETHWLAVSRKNHERIEENKAWARREGFLLNF